MKFFTILFILLSTNACKLESGPEKALKSFVNYSISNDQSLDFFLENTSGKLLSFYEKLDEQQFVKVKEANIKKLKKLKINLRKCNETTCSITYTLNFVSGQEGENEVLAEVRKIAELKNIEGNWKVSDVINVKTFYDSKTPLNP